MSQRILDLVFRRKLLLITPLILGLAFGVFILSGSRTSYYSTHASVWVERPTDLSGGTFQEFDPYLSPAQNQAAAMRELLSINSFAAQIHERVAPGVPVTLYDVDELRNNVSFHAAGQHVLYVSARSLDPVTAQRTVNALVEEYSELYRTQIKDRAARAKAFYEEQLASAKTTQDTSSAELRAYLARNPSLIAADLSNPPASALRDTEYARLRSSEQTAQERYAELLDKYAESQISVNAANGASANFMIMDAPMLPLDPIEPGRRALLMPPLMGIGLGVAVTAAIFFALWRMDRSIRFPEDVALIGLEIPVMALPQLRPRRRWPTSFVRVSTALNNGIRQRLSMAVND